VTVTTALAACTAKKTGGPPEFPKYAGDWTLQSGPEPAESVAGAEGAWVARYSGNPPMRLTVIRMPSQTGAFDAVQRWRAEAGKLAFYKGPFFGIVESPGADHAAMNRFAAAIQSSLPDR
jgi:hypothetical protein